MNTAISVFLAGDGRMLGIEHEIVRLHVCLG